MKNVIIKGINTDAKKLIGAFLAVCMVLTQAVPAGLAGALSLPDDRDGYREEQRAVMDPLAGGQADSGTAPLSPHDMFFAGADQPLSAPTPERLGVEPGSLIKPRPPLPAPHF